MKHFLSMLFLLAAVPLFSWAQWIRINQLGYTPSGIKVAVWCSKDKEMMKDWQLIDASSNKVVLYGKAGKNFGEYGPFAQTYRLNFSTYKIAGKYFLKAGKTKSPVFAIAADVYKGTADFALRYMRQQRCGFNPFLKDSCHTADGYTLYASKAGQPDSSFIDATGGWHDASDYLKYVTTTANASYHLLMAYRDFPFVFGDEKLSNGLDGSNRIPDVLDEASWGMQWLLKMHPSPKLMFNQVADDRDHISMRMPGLDSQYGRGNQRPVYFINGLPQQRGKFLNQTNGTSSTAAKISSVFSLGYQQLLSFDKKLALTVWPKALTALHYAEQKYGVTQTVSVRSPYIYAEENWSDDMELQYAAYASVVHDMKGYALTSRDAAYRMANKEPITPWLAADTANHYQWYPFINLGHRELSKLLLNSTFIPTQADKNKKMADQLVNWYKQGIVSVWTKAKENAFYRGVPFIWCSNNLTTAFATQCHWYKELSGDDQFLELEQANVDWLFGCNPWGTSMVYGLPADGDTPTDPHSAFTHLKNYPIDGGLVDGPVYTSIFENLIGIKLNDADEYKAFQSNLAVYHDDYGDYSTNEPTMDGTASLVYLLAAKEAEGYKTPKEKRKNQLIEREAIRSGDTTQKNIALIFSAHEFGDGAQHISSILKKENINASFFFTGDFCRNKSYKSFIASLVANGHYLGAHSDKHLLYCDWEKRDSLLISKETFNADLSKNYKELEKFGVSKEDAEWFLPPYEWYNDSIATWAKQKGIQLINFTPGTFLTSDYTWPELKNYKSSETIYKSVLARAEVKPSGLNGYILLIHLGTDPKRSDKFYNYLPQLIAFLKSRGYQFKRIDELLAEKK